MGDSGTRAILEYWRQVEIINPPSIPEKAHPKTMRWGSPPPWDPRSGDDHSPGCALYVVYVGVAPAREWVRRILAAIKVTNPCQYDLDRIAGRIWMAAFIVDGHGRPDAGSYVHATFPVGIRRLLEGKSLDDIETDMRLLRDGFESRRQPASDPPGSEASPMGWKELEEELRKAVGSSEFGAPGAFDIVVRGVVGGQEPAEDRKKREIDYLQSFYLKDIEMLVAEATAEKTLGNALDAYMGCGGNGGRKTDVLTDHAAMEACLSPKKLPLGRWPAPSRHQLYLAQQAAVATIISSLADGAGLVAVNGPPGTGKTTLLRDVIADVVVRRARWLASLADPVAIFQRAAWSVGGMDFRPVDGDAARGSWIVVTSSNNNAVEIISLELPDANSVDALEYSSPAYLKPVAMNVAKQQRRSKGRKKPKQQKDPWGLVSAALGKQGNIDAFLDGYSPEYGPPRAAPGQPADIVAWLGSSDVTPARWRELREDFDAKLKDVESRRARLESIETAFRSLDGIRLDITSRNAEIAKSSRDMVAAEADWKARLEPLAHVVAEHAARKQEAEWFAKESEAAMSAAEARESQARTDRRPNLWDRLMGVFGRRTENVAAWDNRLSEAVGARASAADLLGERVRSLRQSAAELDKAKKSHAGKLAERERAIRELQTKHAAAKAELKVLERRCSDGEALTAAFTGEDGVRPNSDHLAKLTGEQRHRISAWVNRDFDHRRSQLFLAALRLHEGALAANKRTVIANLRVVRAMLAGHSKVPIKDQERAQVWDMLFLTVPVVSTTLASFGRLFKGVERGRIGWLLIDEAGQATPQSVVGAMWRSRRVVVVGDPKQIEPVMAIPAEIVADLGRRHKVTEGWSPAVESAQSLADRTMAVGAFIGESGAEGSVWTGLPLRTHRRCAEPMFGIANAIAYRGQMVQADPQGAEKKSRAFECLLGPSAWFDVRGGASSGQVVEAEIDRLELMLRALRDRWPQTKDADGEDADASLIVVSPFRQVADAAQRLSKELGVDAACGTVHKFQGREADIVILMLGSAPGQDGIGSRGWASKRPNLLNVALTRAKLRAYVVGSVQDWGVCPYFRELKPIVREFPLGDVG